MNPPNAPDHPTPPLRVGWLVNFALLYGAAIILGRLSFLPDEPLPGVWPAGGVVIAALLLAGKRERLVLLAITAAGNYLAYANPAAPLAGWAAALLAVVEAAAIVGLLERWRGRPVTFLRLADVLGLAGAAIPLTALLALPAVWLYHSAGSHPLAEIYLLQWIAHSLGVLLAAPLVMVWAQPASGGAALRPARRFEAAAWLAFLGATGWYIFGAPDLDLPWEPRPYMLFPILLWATLRFDTRAVAGGLAVIGGLALALTQSGIGTFPLGGETPAARLLAVSSFFLVAVVTMLVLSAALGERRLAADSLRESQERLDLALRSANMGVWRWEIAGNRRYLDERTCRLLGLNPETFQGTAAEYYRTFHPEDVSRVQAALKATAESDAPYAAAYRVVWPDGSIHHIAARGRLVRGADGRPARVLGLSWDISAQKIDEMLLAARADLRDVGASGTLDALMRQLIDHAENLTGSQIGFFHTLDAQEENLTLQMWSTRTLETMCSAAGKGVHYPVAQAGVWVDALRQRAAVIHNDYASLPHRTSLPDGHAPVIRELVVPVFHENHIVAIIGVGNKACDYHEGDVQVVSELANFAWEVIARKQTEDALREREAWLRESQRAADIGTYHLDIRAGVWRCTPVLDKIFGIADSFAKTIAAWESIVHPDERITMVAYLQEAFTTRKPFDKEYRIVNQSDGRVHWVHGRGELTFAESGEPVEMVGTIIDITARKQAEIERARLTLELARKNKEMESIVYIASHDLRSPLVNIQGFGRNLQKYIHKITDQLNNAEDLTALRSAVQPLLAERIPAALRFIEAGSNKMDTLIDGLLQVSRVGRAPLNFQEVDAAAILRSIRDALSYQLDRAGATFQVIEPLPACRGDANQLNQVFTNLLDNAIKYRHPDRPLQITISGVQTAGLVRYTIADNGVGVAPENAEKIFELFHRLERDAQIPGDGLGLTLARRIVERYGGRIWVESQPGNGCQFFIELPAPGGETPA